MTKYREYFKKMLDENREIFDEFKNIHDRYGLDMNNLQEEFNEVGKRVFKVIREYENRLCNRSESNGYGSYTGSLAQKFMDEIRGLFPHIDRVGIIVKKSSPGVSIPKLSPVSKSEFSLKKLRLN